MVADGGVAAVAGEQKGQWHKATTHTSTSLLGWPHLMAWTLPDQGRQV